MAGSALHCRQTRELLDEEDAELIVHLEVAPRVLSLQLLRQVSPGRAAVLRAWVIGMGPPHCRPRCCSRRWTSCCQPATIAERGCAGTIMPSSNGAIAYSARATAGASP